MIRVVWLLVATMLVPMGFLVAGDLRDYRDAEQTVSTVTTVQGVQALIHELQKERGLTVGLLGGDSRFRGQLAGQRALTDQALVALRRQLDQGMRGGSTVRSAMAPLGNLAIERSAVDRGTTDRSGALRYYTDSIASLGSLDISTGSTSDPALQRGLEALQALGDAKEFTGRERAVLSGVFAARRIDQADYLILLDDLAGKKATLGMFAKTATAAEQARLAAVQASSAATQAAGYENIAVASGGQTLSQQVDPVAWFTTMTTYIDSLRQVQIGIGADVDARAAALRGAAGRRLAGLALLAVAVVLFEVWLAVRALRSVVGPLARLAGDAQDLA
ncbi:MAG: nitrate- and nitrite sensing domain-containing protein, partial [Catenulispora sp.]|nr:nitrate- and nitrite sensing domain-containing protein [Catenulispora sp.]